MQPALKVFSRLFLAVALGLFGAACSASDSAAPHQESVSANAVASPRGAEPPSDVFPQQGPEDDPSRPVNAGPNASESCLRRVVGGGAAVQITGSIQAPAALPVGADGRFVVLALDQRLDSLEPNRVIQAFGAVASEQSEFELSFAAPQQPVWLCAVGPAELGGIAYFSHLGCSSAALDLSQAGTATPPTVQIELRRGERHLGLIGLSQFDERSGDGERLRRTLSGRIEAADGSQAPYFIAAAAADVLGGPDVAVDPRVVGAVGAGQNFRLSYLAPADEPLWFCAIALPPPGKTAFDVDSLAGAGCARYAFPAGSEGVQLEGLVHPIKSGEPVPLTPHEREHYTMLQRCFLQ